MLYIHGIGHFHPDNVIDNEFLRQLNIDSDNEWIIERVGILTRRTVLSLDYIRTTYNKDPQALGDHIQFSNAQMAVKACRIALERANLKPDDIGLVIAGGCVPQYSMPAEACMIAAELGINVPAYDINSACSTFAVHMHIIDQMQTETSPDYILSVIPESVTRSVNYSDRKVAALWGDGAAATIVSKKITSNVSISHTTIASNPLDWKKVTTPAGGHFYQEGLTVQKFAITKTLMTLKELREKMHIDPQQHYFIGHQANLLMLQSVCKIAGIFEDKHLYNVDQFGNCGAAGAPTVLSQNWSRFRGGDTATLIVVGAGLTWGGMMIKFS